MMNKYQVGIAAEASVAAALARAGCNILVQYGANQPEFDLIASKGGKNLRISVKGSRDGSWIAAGAFKKSALTNAETLRIWEKDHDERTIFVFVQFENIPFDKLPLMYMASVHEVAEHLSKTRAGKIDLVLYITRTFKSGVAKDHTDNIPVEWELTENRVDEMFRLYA